MKSKPEKGNASVVGATEASNVNNQEVNQGFNMTNSIVVPANTQPVFNFADNQVRLVVRDGEPWFVATDVATTLGYRNAPDASRHLDDDEKGTHILRTPGGDQSLTVINESGLYALVLRSRKPEARKFAKWVTREVLPSIRKTGQYQQPVAQANPAVDYGRISPAQAQDLREIVQAIVEAKIQGHSETWARLQRKFRVNSYLQLPVSRYEEARAYLIGKLPQGYAGELFEEEKPAMDMALVESAMSAANAVAMQIQQTAFMAMLKSETLQRGRWMVSFGYGADGFKPNVKPVDEGAYVATLPQMAKWIQDPSMLLESQDLMNLAKACMNRLATRLEVRQLAA